VAGSVTAANETGAQVFLSRRDGFDVERYLRFSAMLAAYVLGLFLMALGIALTLRAGLGLGPWDVLHQGMSRHTPLTFGQASQVVGALVILVGLLLRVRPRLGTILDMLLVGFFVDRILGTSLIPDPRPGGLPIQALMDVFGVLLLGLGSGLYIRANLGAGPRDGLMLGLQQVTGRRLAVVRVGLELSGVAMGFLLGGTVGVGTLVYALGIGPSVELGFRVFGVPRQRYEARVTWPGEGASSVALPLPGRHSIPTCRPRQVDTDCWQGTDDDRPGLRRYPTMPEAA
jgi:uncharacterized membrane protein YczE